MTHPLAPETQAQELISYAVDGAFERLELLRDIAADHDPISLHLRDGSGKVLVCTLLPVGSEDEQTGAALGFELSVSAPADLLQRLPLAVTAVTVHRDVKVQFDLLLRTDARSTELLRAELPEALWHFQRRQAFRIEPPPASPVRLSIRYPTVNDTSRSVKVIDISVNGVAFLWPRWEERLPQPGDRLGETRLDLAGQMPLSCTLEVSVVAPVDEPGSGTEERRNKVGCRFVNLPLAAGRAIQVYVNAAQIRARARRERDRKRG